MNRRARDERGWKPRHVFAALLPRLTMGDDFRCPLAQLVGSKGYHAESFSDRPFPVES